MANQEVLCKCTQEKCNHPNGELCGKPVEHSYPAVFKDGAGRNIGEEFALGYCDACLANAGYQPK
jgi:hypothetical protein